MRTSAGESTPGASARTYARAMLITTAAGMPRTLVSSMITPRCVSSMRK